MQNVIEQSVLDNNWMPTAESAGHANQALSMTSLVAILVLPYLNNIIINSFIVIFFTISNFEILEHGAR